MKVFVLGGAGYIGQHVVSSLSGVNEIIIVDRDSFKPELSKQFNASYHILDLTSDGAATELERVFQGATRNDVVIHLAAKKSVAESIDHPDLYLKDNVQITLNVLEAMKATGIRRIIFASTAAVYGNQDCALSENAPCQPVSPYGVSKLYEENLLMGESKTGIIDPLILRLFNVIGTKFPEADLSKGENLVPIAINAARHDLPVKIFGTDYETPDGTCLRDYVDVNDVSRLICLAIEDARGLGDFVGILNVASGVSSSVLEVINQIQKYIPLKVKFCDKRLGDISAVIVDTSKAMEVLGWEAQTTLENSIKSYF